MFDVKYIDEEIAKCKTEKEQIYSLSITMLHEMVHQYCFENGIMDMGDHDDWWWDIAEQHGLKHRIDDNGVENESLDQWKAAGINLYFRLR